MLGGADELDAERAPLSWGAVPFVLFLVMAMRQMR
jgi:hypothetical protein